MPIPGQLDIAQVYNDSWRGWPVRPHNRQHPIRGSFLDPRPDPERGAIYHDGIDVAVRDDRPERGAPAGRTHRVYAIEGGPVFLATPRGARGFARVGHFGYGHIDPIVQTGEIGGARTAHRLDVSRGLARPPERVHLHERASDRRQSSSAGRKAASLRRHSPDRRFARFASTRRRIPRGRGGRRPASHAYRTQGRVSHAIDSSAVSTCACA